MLNLKMAALLAILSYCAFLNGQYSKPASSPTPTHPVAPVVCPWLTQGTAEATLGGSVSVTASVSDNGEGVCKFVRRQGPADLLEITVRKAALPACPPGSPPIKGIGNHAELCNRPGSSGESVQMLSSRVRDQYFTLTLTSHSIQKQKPIDPQDQPLENIGEQVAGNLY